VRAIQSYRLHYVLLVALFLSSGVSFTGASAGRKGGTIVTATFTDVRTFNAFSSTDTETKTYSRLIHAGLTQLNGLTQQPEPSLAESWETSEDELTWTFHLRKALKWSDGEPFVPDDVLFTMNIVNDPNVPSSAHDSLTSKGKIEWSIVGENAIQARMHSKFVTFLRHLEPGTCPILPKHKWEKSYREGHFADTMRADMNPEDSVGLGPFRLGAYIPGQKVTFVRNPFYWKTARRGTALPYLNGITFLILGNQDQIELRIESGEIDTYQNIRPSDVQTLREKENALQLEVKNAGASMDMEGVFFNQNDSENPIKRAWFADKNFRLAVAHAIDRDTLVKNCFYGQGFPAFGPESPGNKLWFNPKVPRFGFDLKSAHQLLLKSGFQFKTEAGKPRLFDAKGNAVRFSLYTNSGSSVHNAECILIVSDLAKLGIEVDYSVIDFATLVNRINVTFDYDAVLLGMSHDDPDPAERLNAFLSSGSLHFWRPRQLQPYTPWEKRIDQLMNATMSTSDAEERKKYYDEVQVILAEQQPMIFTVHPYVFVCAKKKIGNMKPGISRHRTLWNAEELYWEQ